MDAYWKNVRKEIKAGYKIGLAMGEAGNQGIHTIEVYHTDFIGPIGVCWFLFSSRDRIEILNIYVDDRLRRCGLGRYLHDGLIRFYPSRVIVSHSGSKLGEPWMKAVGYKLTPAGWEYRKHLKEK